MRGFVEIGALGLIDQPEACAHRQGGHQEQDEFQGAVGPVLLLLALAAVGEKLLCVLLGTHTSW